MVDPNRTREDRNAARRRRRGQPSADRWRDRRRRAIALLILVAIGTAAFLVLRSDDEAHQPSKPAVTANTAGAKLSTRIKRLQARLDQASRAEAEAASAAPAQRIGKSVSGSFEGLAHGLPGSVGIAYTSPGKSSAISTSGDLQTGSAWSTIKVALAARVIKDAHGTSHLTSSQRSLIASALRESDNAAAMSLWEELVSRYGGAGGAAGAVTQVLAQAGDASTSVSSVGRASFSPYGQTDWSLDGQVRFMASLTAGCVPGSRYLLDQMSQVVSDQRWGLGSAGSNEFKGGWGPGTDGGYLVRQMGTLPTSGGTAAVAIAALPNDGQFATGQTMLGEVSRWASDHLRPAAPTGC
jgi:hypothetical protein